MLWDAIRPYLYAWQALRNPRQGGRERKGKEETRFRKVTHTWYTLRHPCEERKGCFREAFGRRNGKGRRKKVFRDVMTHPRIPAIDGKIFGREMEGGKLKERTGKEDTGELFRGTTDHTCFPPREERAHASVSYHDFDNLDHLDPSGHVCTACPYEMFCRICIALIPTQERCAGSCGLCGSHQHHDLDPRIST